MFALRKLIFTDYKHIFINAKLIFSDRKHNFSSCKDTSFYRFYQIKLLQFIKKTVSNRQRKHIKLYSELLHLVYS